MSKRPAGQVCIGEAFSKLAKYERDSGKMKMLTKNVATYAAIPIPQRARTDEELTHPLAWYLTSLFKATFLFNCIIYFSVLQAECSLM